MTNPIPIFPLNTVLFPGGALPLKIFEQRYLEMTKACLRDSTPFGVCRIREGAEVGMPAAHELIGCTASIAEWDMPHLGLFHLRAQGQTVFRIVESETEANGLIRARIEPLPESIGKVAEEDLKLCAGVLERVFAQVDASHFGTVALHDARWVSYRLAELLPLEPADCQALLEERVDAARIARLVQLLQSV
jgi:uncharacterized protein